MGRDLTLYPAHGSRAALKGYLESLGFTRCSHLWVWPRGTLNYSWFDASDFRSIDGVSADIYPVSGEEPALTPTGWAMHVRNRYCASWHDVRMLNDVLRGARRRFGGTIVGDYGTNRYAPLWDDRSTPISRGIALVYHRVKQDLQSVRIALPHPVARQAKPDPADHRNIRNFIELTNSLDPSRVIYNGLVPFAVALFEHFFGQAFRVLIAHDPRALEKRLSHKHTVDFPTLLHVSTGKQTVEDVISQSYTFQNLAQLNKAYKEWLDIDVRKLLFKKKRIGRAVTFLEHRIAEIIAYRHGVVHHLALDLSLTRDEYLAILRAVETSMNEFVAFVELKYGVPIDRDD